MNIVIIDNNLFTCRALAAWLNSFAKKNNIQVKIYTSNNGVDGLGMVYIAQPDFIFLDSNLPKYGGKELSDYILNNKSLENSDLILTSSTTDESESSVINKRSGNFAREISGILYEKIYGKKQPKIFTYSRLLASRIVNRIVGNSLFVDSLQLQIAKSKNSFRMLALGIVKDSVQISQIVLLLFLYFILGWPQREDIIAATNQKLSFSLRQNPILGVFLILFVVGFMQVFIYATNGIQIFNYRLSSIFATSGEYEVPFENLDYDSNLIRVDVDQIFLKDLSEEENGSGTSLPTDEVTPSATENSEASPTPSSFPDNGAGSSEEITPTDEASPSVESTEEVTPTENPTEEITPTEEVTPTGEVAPTAEVTAEASPTEAPTEEVTPTEEITPSSTKVDDASNSEPDTGNPSELVSNLQYRVIHSPRVLGISDEDITNYSTARPAIIFKDPIEFSTITNILENSSSNDEITSLREPTFGYTLDNFQQNGITYQLSPDGENWYFYDGIEWLRTENDWINSNTIQEVNKYLANFPTGTKKIYLKIFLHSDGYIRTSLNKITVNRDIDLITPVEEITPTPTLTPTPIIDSPIGFEIKPVLLSASWFNGNKIITGRLDLPDGKSLSETELANLRIDIYYTEDSDYYVPATSKSKFIGSTDIISTARGYKFTLITPEEPGGYVTAELVYASKSTNTEGQDTTEEKIISDLTNPMENSTFTVDSTADDADTSGGDGICATGLGECTLRAALWETSSLAGADNIHFNIAGAGPFTIQPANVGSTTLFDTSAVVIDASTQPGSDCSTQTLKIILDGSLGVVPDGFLVYNVSTTIKGFVIKNFTRDGIQLDSLADNSIVQCNIIGLDSDGTTAAGNARYGVYVRGDGVQIGGTIASERNIISANQVGILSDITPIANNLTVKGNYIGTDITGTLDRGNTDNGMYILGGTGHTIGGDNTGYPNCSGACNVISGNTFYGMQVAGEANIYGNFIGTTVDGQSALANVDGIFIQKDNVNIGDGTQLHRNVISGNSDDGVFFSNGVSYSNRIIDDNYICTDSDGTTALANGGDGIEFTASLSTAYSQNDILRNNVISGCGAIGVNINTATKSISLYGNKIGVGANGTDVIPNQTGIYYDNVNALLNSEKVLIGDPGQTANIIANNTSYGIRLVSNAYAQIENNEIYSNGSGIRVENAGTIANILENSIYSNTGLGIDLLANGVTANDAGDGDTGPNGLQNFPVLNYWADSGADTLVYGTLSTTASSDYRIDFWANTTPDGLGNGEGEEYLGSANVTTNGAGLYDFSSTPITLTGVNPSVGKNYISAVATICSNPPGCTTLTGSSEFSVNVTVANQISGTIYDDVDGNGTIGGSDAGVSGVTIKFYTDDGDNTPDAGDTLYATVATGVGGTYTTNVVDNTYWMVVDSSTVLPSTAYASTPLADQTYGSAGARCSDGAGGISTLVAAGTCFGGQKTSTADNAAVLTTAEHVTKIVMAGSAATNINSAFSFITVTNANNSGQGTLRQVITNANNITGAQSANFELQGDDTNYNNNGTVGLTTDDFWRIVPTTVLPTISQDLILDASTQSGASCATHTPKVEIRKAAAGGFNGLTVSGDNVEIRGFVINNFLNGISFTSTADSGLIACNFIGVDHLATSAVGNTNSGILVRGGTQLQIGGSNPDDLNIISKSTTADIDIATNPNSLTIEGNYMGVAADGTTALSTSPYGIFIASGTNIIIGGAAAANGNIIKNNDIGIYADSISTNGASYSLQISHNEISNNTISGIDLENIPASTLVHIDNNTLDQNGIFYAIFANSVDADTPGDVLIESNTITNTQSTGGISLNDARVYITNNVISTNAGKGIEVIDNGVFTDAYSVIVANQIYSNTGIGIDLGNDGVTANDATMDSDGGANDLQNYPSLSSYTQNGADLDIYGTLHSLANTQFRIDFYSNTVADSSGYGEGKTHLGYSVITTNGSGNYDFSSTPITLLTTSMPVGEDYLSSTATICISSPGCDDLGAATSEFSNTVATNSITGKIYDDLTGDGDITGDPGISGATVNLYLDDGDNTPDAGDTLTAGSTTDINGNYTLSTVNGTYWIQVVGSTVKSTITPAATVLGDETYASIGGRCSDGAGGSTILVAAGSCYGGARPNAADNTATLATSEHLIKVTVAGSNVTGGDMAFSFVTVTNTNDSGQGSLSQVITNTNNISGSQSVNFEFADDDTNYNTNGTGILSDDYWRITQTALLPTISEQLTLDASTQSGASCASLTPKVQLYGTAAFAGLTISGDNVEIRGFVISNFTNAISLTGSADSANIVCNFLGTNHLGLSAAANTAYGITISGGSSHQIGGSTTSDINVISGNTNSGINIGGNSNSVTIEGNYIGVGSDSTTSIGNSAYGILIGSSVNTMIGGTTTNETNIIKNNLIGIGTSGINSNGASYSLQILNNNISNNTNTGIDLESITASTLVHIKDNTIDSNGTQYGILTYLLEPDNPADILIESNTITNTTGLGGIWVVDSRAYFSNNIITGNAGKGIETVDFGTILNPYSVFIGNQIYNNTGIGIDIEMDGVDINDLGDGDSGSNARQNYPDLVGYQINGADLDIYGSFNSTANTQYRIDYFANTAADGSGYGEGETHIGYSIITTDGGGDYDFSTTPMTLTTTSLPVGQTFVTSTATLCITSPSCDDLDNTTSEFSNAVSAVNYLSGTIYDDLAGDGDITGDPGIPSATLNIYLDDGDGVPDAGDTFKTTKITDASGNYSALVEDGVYWVRVNGSTVKSTITPAATVLGDETYASIGGRCSDGAGGTTILAAAGSCYGGSRPNTADNTGALATSEHLIKITMSGTDVTGTNMAFSFVTVTNANESGQGTIRQVITNSNNIAGAQSVNFELATDDTNYNTNATVTTTDDFWRVVPATVLPTITEQLTLDASTQSGASCNVLTPKVEIRRAAAGGFNGLTISGNNVVVRGFVINNFTDGISSTGSNGVIACNIIGLDHLGTTRVGNTTRGVFVSDGDANIIGGTVSSDRNIISGNTRNIRIVGSTGAVVADGNQILGNYIGTDITGLVSLSPTTATSVEITSSAGSVDNTLVDSNVIAGHTTTGLFVDFNVDSTTITNNYIGVGSDGTTDITSAGFGYGVYTTSSTNVIIGGSSDANLIKNHYVGIYAVGIGANGVSYSLQILNNDISQNSSTGIDLENIAAGVLVHIQDNTIDQNGNFYGIYTDNINSTLPSDVLIESNTISNTQSSGGILLSDSRLYLTDNIINSNAGNGIDLQNFAFLVSPHSIFITNQIYNNTGIGIDFDIDGVSANDVGDGDTGVNGLQNYPDLIGYQIDGADLDIYGSFNSTANTQYRIDYFANTVADGTGYGEGETHLGYSIITTDGSGDYDFSTTPMTLTATSLPVGQAIVTSTATECTTSSGCGDLNNATSEFSNAVNNVNYLTGTIYEDVNNDSAIGVSDDPKDAVDVYVYEDDGDNTPDAGDTMMSTVATDTNGDYSFLLEDGTYWVGVDVADITPVAGSTGSTLADQTYGVIGAWCSDGAGGTSVLVADGACIGGKRPETADDQSGIATSEHITQVTMAGANKSGINSAFSFDIVTNANTDAQGSLSQFITNSNNTNGVQTSQFLLSDDDPNYNNNATIGTTTDDFWQIPLTTVLPTISAQVSLDATTQSGYGSQPVVAIDAQAYAGFVEILQLTAGDSTIAGFSIYNPNNSVDLLEITSSNNTIKANIFGSDPNGSYATASVNNIVISSGTGNTIGGDASGERNVLSNAGTSAITINSNNNNITGNYIGSNSAGTSIPSVMGSGIVLASGVTGNQIGGTNHTANTCDGECNLIVGGDYGIVLNSTSSTNTVEGNFIGTNITGTSSLPNNIAGIKIQGTSNTIGGTSSLSRNLISGNTQNGIEISSASDNIILNNYIGTDITGTLDLGNLQGGIYILDSFDNTIGSSNISEANLIACNDLNGVYISGSNSSGNILQNNLVGVLADQTTACGNFEDGIQIDDDAHDNDILTGNIIANNLNDGIEIINNVSTIQNDISQNSIYANGALGIDLAGGVEDGFTVTANDADDSDSGANNLQNFAIITSVHQGSTIIKGSLTSTPSSTFTVEFYTNTAADASGYGEGTTYLGSAVINTDIAGLATINSTFATTAALGDEITSIVRDASGNVSEFSLSSTVLPANVDGTLTVSPSAINYGQIFTIQVDDADLNANVLVAETITVGVVNIRTGESETVTLTETGVNTGIFTSTLVTTFNTAAGTNDDGTMNVQGGDTLTTTYTDAATLTGGTATLTDDVTINPTSDGTLSATPAINPGASVTIQVADSDLNVNILVAETITVTTVNNTTGESETITLTETGVNTGIFNATLATTNSAGAGTDDDGNMNVQAADTLTTTYTDNATSTNGTSVLTQNTTVNIGNDGVLTVSASSIKAGKAVTIQVIDIDLDTDPLVIETVTVTVVNSRTGENETVTLTETGVNTGTFTAILTTSNTLATGTNDDGVMNVQKNDILTATYTDTFTSTGATNTSSEDVAITSNSSGSSRRVVSSTPIVTTIIPTSTGEITFSPTTTEEPTVSPTEIVEINPELSLEIINVIVRENKDLNQVEICWDTNVPAGGYVKYGINNYDFSSNKITDYSSAHRCVILYKIELNQKYQFEIYAFIPELHTDYEGTFEIKDLKEVNQELPIVSGETVNSFLLLAPVVMIAIINLSLMPGILYNFLMSIILGKRHKWGFIFDQSNMTILPYTKVQLKFDDKILTTYTDKEGMYGFGEISEEINSIFVNGVEHISNLKVKTDKKPREIVLDIPADSFAGKLEGWDLIKLQIWKAVHNSMKYLGIAVFVIMLAFSVYVAITTPTILNALIVGVYAVQVGLWFRSSKAITRKLIHRRGEEMILKKAADNDL